VVSGGGKGEDGCKGGEVGARGLGAKGREAGGGGVGQSGVRGLEREGKGGKARDEGKRTGMWGGLVGVGVRGKRGL